MILKRIYCLAAALAIVVPSFAGINRNDVKEIADRVADWQIANFKNVSYSGKKRAPSRLGQRSIVPRHGRVVCEDRLPASRGLRDEHRQDT